MPRQRKRNRTSGLPWGQGQVVQKDSGRWQARLPVGGGKRTTKTFDTWDEATAWLAAANRRSVTADQVFGIYLDDEWLPPREVGWRPNTVASYHNTLKHIRSTFENLTFAEIDQQTVNDWYRGRVAAGVGSNTLAKALTLLLRIVHDAEEDGRDVNRLREPVKGASKHRPQERQIPTPEQLAQIIEALPDRWRWPAVLTSRAGLRWGEIAALRKRDLDFERGEIHVREAVQEVSTRASMKIDQTKSTAGVRDVPVGREAMDWMKRWLEVHAADAGPHDLIFTDDTGQMYRRKSWTKVFDQAVSKAGLDYVTPKYTPHVFRHYFGTAAGLNGASIPDLMKLLGHSSPRAALIYQHAASQSTDRLRPLAESVEAWSAGGLPHPGPQKGPAKGPGSGGNHGRAGE